MIEPTVTQIANELPQYIKPPGSPTRISPGDLTTVLTKILKRLDACVKSQTLTPYEYGLVGNPTAAVSDWIGTGKPYANLAALQVDYPHVSHTTDLIDWAAIQKACDVAYTAPSGGKRRTIRIPNGLFWANKTITLGHEVTLEGEGRANSVIAAAIGFPAFAPMVQLSRGQIDYEHANAVRKLGLDCYGRAHTGIRGYNVNEHGGVYESEVKNFTHRGIHIGPEAGKTYNNVLNFRIHDLHVVTNYAEPGSIGIYIKDVNHPLSIHKGTIIMERKLRPGWVPGTARDQIGIKIESGDAFRANIEDWHIEESNIGVFVEYGRAIMRNVEGWNNVNSTVTFAATSSPSIAEYITNMNPQGFCITDLGRVRTTEGHPLRYGDSVGPGKFFDRAYANNYATPDLLSMGAGYSVSATNTPIGSGTYAGYYKIWHRARVKPRVVIPVIYNTAGYRIREIAIEEEDVFVKVYDNAGSLVTGMQSFGMYVEI